MAGVCRCWALTGVVIAALVTASSAQGTCLVSVPVGAQCGGNESNPYMTCANFRSCGNEAWAGACCPAGKACQPLGGDSCWTCGGVLPPQLSDLPDAIEGQCARMVGSDFDYSCTLGASMFFYEAQRLGELTPENTPVSWRGPTGLNDTAPNGASLVGGWFDAGDTTRFTFPAAYTISTLALGYVAFPEGYDKGGHTARLKANLRWGADWIMKARFTPSHLVAVTWAPGVSIKEAHLFWGHPEDVRTPAAVRALGPGQPGADLLSQAAAALASTAVVFKKEDPQYAAQLVSVAQGLFSQAKDQEGFYSDSVPEVKGYYTSFSFIDDLAWAAAWIALATGDKFAAEEARLYWLRHISDEGGGEGRRYDYNNLQQGLGYVMSLLYPAKKDQYLQPIRSVMGLWLTSKSNISYTAKGMAYIDSWGNLRYVANQALMALLHTKAYSGEQSRRSLVYTCFARKQLRLMLGESGRSYVVGIGNNPVCRPHHRASSCGPLGTRCDCSALRNPGCNPNVLYGALVGGPGADDGYEDARGNYQQNEVALDWNAGFSGVLSALSGGGLPTWEDCKKAGLADMRGSAGSDLSAAGAPRGGGGGLGAVALAAGLAVAMGRLVAGL